MKAINIIWDIDYENELLELPIEIELPIGMEDEDEISDYLSDTTGFCHKGFGLKYSRLDEVLNVHEKLKKAKSEVTKIWDKAYKEFKIAVEHIDEEMLRDYDYHSIKSILEYNTFFRTYGRPDKIRELLREKKEQMYPDLISKATYYPEINNLHISLEDKLRLDREAYRHYWSRSGKFSDEDIKLLVSVGVMELRHNIYGHLLEDEKFSKHKKVWELKDINILSNDLKTELDNLRKEGFGIITFMRDRNSNKIVKIDDEKSLECWYDGIVYIVEKKPDLTYENL